MSCDAPDTSRGMDRLSPVVLWMDAANGHTDTSTQQQQLELAADVEMNELPVSVPDSVAAASLSSPGLDAAGISDLAACRLALEQAQRVRRANVVCVLLLFHFAFLILYFNRQTCSSWRKITRCEWCGIVAFMIFLFACILFLLSASNSTIFHPWPAITCRHNTRPTCPATAQLCSRLVLRANRLFHFLLIDADCCSGARICNNNGTVR
jgi:hypothetical protein